MIELRLMMMSMSMSFMFGEGGMLALMVGMNETKASTNTATVANLLESDFS